MVELMGHQRIAGHITEKAFGSNVMLQVDVPAVGENPAFSRILSFSAIYAINPCTEEVATKIADSIREVPIVDYNMRTHVNAALKTAIESGKLVPAGNVESGEDEEDNPHYLTELEHF